MTYIAGYPGHTSGPNGAITRIVLHATVSPCVPGGARRVAAYFQEPTAGGLAHYVVDPGEVVQCCPDDTACWHAPPNPGSIGVELCDPQSGDSARWSDASHTAMLTRAAALVADLCRRHNVPAVYVNAQDLLAGKHGVTTHHAVSSAWHKSTHTDPGDAFPLAAFMAQVAAHLTRPAPTPTPAPTPAPRPLEAHVLFLAYHSDHTHYIVEMTVHGCTKRPISPAEERLYHAGGVQAASPALTDAQITAIPAAGAA